MLSTNDLKRELREAIASKNRGILATATDQQAIASVIARVEALNPTPNPLSATDLLAGDWRLLYTTSQELLGIDKVPFVRLGEIYQCVRPAQSRIYNIAEVPSLPYFDGLVSVVAGFVPAPGDTPEQVSQRRVNVQFNRAVFGLQRALGYRDVPQYIEKLEAIAKFNLLQGIDFAIDAGRQQGWLEVTYLDEDLRIGRGNQGSLFVLTKDPV